MSQIPASQHGTQNFQPHPTMFPVPQTPKKHKYICAGKFRFDGTVSFAIIS
jgi:hypothetical protein